MSVAVSDVAQKRSGELTHPIGSTRSMQTKTQGSDVMGGDDIGENAYMTLAEGIPMKGV